MFGKTPITFGVPFLLMGLFFQNCTDDGVSFDSESYLQYLYACAEDPNHAEDCPNVKREQFAKSFSVAPTDILFVLDDSCSMRTIANSMASGFASLQEATYPGDTRMGLTYMAPVNVDEMGFLDFLTPYHRNVPVETPGLVKLVNKQNVDNYVAAYPNHSEYFQMEVCNESWFSPGQKNSNGDSCLSAAAQLAPICTGVEAGLVTLEQILNRYTLNNQRLFREDAFVNIIFVSDTHEPGANYFGRPNAYERMKSYGEIVSLINENSPGISSLKMGGILPLPVDGHEAYEGLNVIGAKPQTEEESYINGEGNWDFSYLPYIKETGGSVSHANASNWTGIANSLVQDTKTTGTLVLTLADRADRILSVLINGEAVAQEDWSISANSRVITIKHTSDTSTTLNIDIIYEVPLEGIAGSSGRNNSI